MPDYEPGSADDIAQLMQDDLDRARPTVTMYVATINTTGYLPDSEPTYFGTPGAAWRHLAEERDCEEINAGILDDSETLTRLRSRARFASLEPHWSEATGVEYGDTPGREGPHDLGKAYVVDVAEVTVDEDGEPILDDDGQPTG